MRLPTSVPSTFPPLPPAAPFRRLIIAGIAVAVVLVALLALNPFYTVQSGTVGLKTAFGSVQPEALPPGLHFAIPFYQSVVTVSTQPQTVTSNETAATHDLQTVQTAIAVTFHIDPAEASYFWQNFRSFDTVGQRIITPSVSNDVKAITARYDAQELVTSRDRIDAEIKDLVVASLAPYHLTVETVNVANFAFSEAYEQAIEQKQVAQQQALQAQYTLQQTQISAQQQVVQAKAAADATVATANGNAQATVLQAQAEAKANTLVNASLTPEILQLRALSRWNGVMPTYLTGNTPLPFIGATPGR
ncbi:prohibitin family protein [Acidisoma silvae]|uniref:Prohibitin family protein n=1 Tax=Acidisoma silvae TaxID=2802396 RepID=A0A963YU46_9PROT|nr:prohibitin family protein [Acidisoma silvae]MCB8876597.1 prohibitin family protein [Acidisoma silvae]